MDESDVREISRLFADGQSLLRSKSYEAALAKFDQVLIRNPFYVPALVARADVCDELGTPDRAERCRRRVQFLQGQLQV